MSNTEFVMVPRDVLHDSVNGYEHEQGRARNKLRSLLEQPAQHRQGEPVALPERISMTKLPTEQSSRYHIGERHGWNACLDEIAKLGPLYTHADPGEVEQGYSHEVVQALQTKLDTLRAQLAERDALLREWLELHRRQQQPVTLHERTEAALSASAEPSAPECKGWTCFHCDEHFTDAEAAAIHFGTHEIQRPACLIDAAEYRSMEARVRECANEDSELHRQISRLASNHKLELQRAEEVGYAKGIAEKSASDCDHCAGAGHDYYGEKCDHCKPPAPVERDERAAFEAYYLVDHVFESADFEMDGDRYVWQATQDRWIAWQARAALERKA